jgi:hypothetical protein
MGRSSLLRAVDAAHGFLDLRGHVNRCCKLVFVKCLTAHHEAISRVLATKESFRAPSGWPFQE